MRIYDKLVQWKYNQETLQGKIVGQHWYQGTMLLAILHEKRIIVRDARDVEFLLTEDEHEDAWDQFVVNYRKQND